MDNSTTCCQKLRQHFVKILLFSILIGFIFQCFVSDFLVPTKWATELISGKVQYRMNRLLFKSADDNSSLDTNTTVPMSTLMLTEIIANLSDCPLMPPNLVGPVAISEESPSLEELENKFAARNIGPGGHWKPSFCTARHRVAIVIPFRNREPQLRTFLNYMHPFLQKQQLEYFIIVVEQDQKSKFNRAMLRNIGFVEARKLDDWQCYMFHDVDLLPEDDRNLYSCPPEQPRHMSAAVSTFGYRLPYSDLFGGVSAVTREQFEKVNGYSNKFFGWGGEDDDLSRRLKDRGYKITRYPMDIARYKMLSHKQDVPSPERLQLLASGKERYATDGLNSLTYKLLNVNQLKLYTLVQVEINEAQVMNS